MSNPLDLSVVIDSGSTGSEAGNIICAADMGFTNPVANIGLTLRTGSGTGFVGDVSIAGVTFSNVNATSNFVVQANGNVTLSPALTSYTVTASGTMAITSATGTITRPTCVMWVLVCCISSLRSCWVVDRTAAKPETHR